MQQTSVRGHDDFRRLWTASAISQSGSAIGLVALPVVAVIVLEVTAFQVSLLAAITAVTTALVAFPAGSVIEYRPKRPLMIAADLVRCVSLLSIPGAALADVLTFGHLCVVSAVNAVCVIAFSAAAQAHLKSLVSPERLVDANSKLESTRWMTVAVGPWYFLIPLAVPGPIGLLMCGLGFGAVLFFAGLANSSMASYRQLQTPDGLMARVATLWQFATTVSQPLFILAGGLLVAWLEVRTGLFIAAALMSAAALVLPRR